MIIRPFNEIFEEAMNQEKENFTGKEGSADWLNNAQWFIQKRLPQIQEAEKRLGEYALIIMGYANKVVEATISGNSPPKLSNKQLNRFLEIRVDAIKALVCKHLVYDFFENVPDKLKQDPAMVKALRKLKGHEVMKRIELVAKEGRTITDMDPHIIEEHCTFGKENN